MVRRIVALARTHGVRVIAVRYPSTAEYLESVTPEDEAVINRALGADGIGEVLDFRNVFADASYFKDPDHLSAKGVASLMLLMEHETHRRLRATSPGGYAQAPSALATRPDPI